MRNRIATTDWFAGATLCAVLTIGMPKSGDCGLGYVIVDEEGNVVQSEAGLLACTEWDEISPAACEPALASCGDGGLQAICTRRGFLIQFAFCTTASNPHFGHDYQWVVSGALPPSLLLRTPPGPDDAIGKSTVYVGGNTVIPNVGDFFGQLTGPYCGTFTVTGDCTCPTTPNHIACQSNYPVVMYVIDVGPQPSPSIATSSLPNATVGESYSQPIVVNGGIQDFIFSISSGSLPTGMALDAETGVIFGPPTATGSFAFTVRAAEDPNSPVFDPPPGCAQASNCTVLSTTRNFTIVVNPPPAVATSAQLYADDLTAAAVDVAIQDYLSRVPGNSAPEVIDPVVPSLGEMVSQTVDLALGGLRGLSFSRYHGAFAGQAANFQGFHPTAASPMGNNWMHNYQFLLRRTSATQASIYYAKGRVIFFEKVGGVWQMAPPPTGLAYMGTPYQMAEAGSKLEMMDPNTRTILRFEFAGVANGGVSRVETIRDRNGNTITLMYNPDGTLAQAADGMGRSLTYSYVVAGGFPRIAVVTDQTGRSVSCAYPSNGRLAGVTSSRGTTTTYLYNANHRLSRVTRPEGNQSIINTFGAGDRVTAQTDGEGNVSSLSYVGTVATCTDPLGNAREYEFDANQRLVRWEDEAGQSVAMSYDASHRLLAATDRMGDASAITYHAPSGYVASRIDAEGSTWTYTYAAQPQEGFTFHVLSRIDHPDGTFETWTHDAQGNVLTHADQAGEARSHTYNARGQVLAATNPAGGVSSHTYNADGTLASATDPAGNTTSYAYDAAFRLVQITRPDASAAAFAWDANDNLMSRSDENGNATTYAYDDNDNLAAATNPLGQTTTFAYDGNDDLIATTDPLGASTTFARDGLRRVVSRTDRAGAVTTYVYDARGRRTAIVDPAGETWGYAYDDEGVLTSMTNPLGQATTFATDNLGRRTQTQNPLGNVIAYDYDPLSRLIRVTDPLGQVTDFARDAEGDISDIDMPEAISSNYARSPLDQVTQVADPRANAWQATQDNLGRTTSETDPAANSRAYTYDDRSRIDAVTLPGGLGAVDITYDPASRPTRALFSDGTDLVVAYDADNRATSANAVVLAYNANDRITDCNGVTMAYDADDRLTSMTLAPGKVVTYAYDVRDLVTSVTDWVGATTTFGYDDAGRRVSMTRPNGTAASFTYDAAGRLLSITETAPGPTVLSSIAFIRDARGQVSQLTRDVPLATAPPLASRTFAFDPACQEQSFTYDALGRCTSDGARTYEWDLASRLEGFDAGGSPVAFAHDAAGNIIARTEAGQTRERVWNYALGIPSISIERAQQGRSKTAAGAATDLRYYIHTPDGSLLHSVEASGGARRFYHFDQVGSTLFLTSDAGAITDTYAYSPYGEVVGRSGTSENPFTWHGELGVMEDGGLYNLRARWYDPVAARFLSRDPIRGSDPIRINPYQALFGDPIALVDPRGTDPSRKGGCRAAAYLASGGRCYYDDDLVGGVACGYPCCDCGCDECLAGQSDAEEPGATGGGSPHERDGGAAQVLSTTLANSIESPSTAPGPVSARYDVQSAPGRSTAASAFGMMPLASIHTLAGLSPSVVGDVWEWLKSWFVDKPKPAATPAPVAPAAPPAPAAKCPVDSPRGWPCDGTAGHLGNHGSNKPTSRYERRW